MGFFLNWKLIGGVATPGLPEPSLKRGAVINKTTGSVPKCAHES